MAHQHSHDHASGHEEQNRANGREYGDLSEKYLSDAFSKAFVILKIVMVIVLVWFLASGIFTVEQDEQALVLLFGKVQGQPGSRILEPGLHFAFPEPVNEIIRVPTRKIQSLNIENFWYFQTEQEKISGTPGRVGPDLNPVQDGYTLTRNEKITGIEESDYNIVHARWQLNYRIDNLESFFRNVMYTPPRPGELFNDVLKVFVDPVLQSLASDAIVATMVNYSIDEAIVSAPDIASNVQRLLQDKLEEIDSGISVVSMQVIGRITWPRQVDDAFQSSIKAQQESKRMVLEARGRADSILSAAGGPRAEQLLTELRKDDVPQEERLALLDQLSGRAQETISRARAYRTRLVEDARANADYLQQLLPEYRLRPKLVLQRIYQDAVEEILANVDEKILVESSQGDKARELRVLINRNPDIRKKQTQDQNQK